MPTRFRRHRQVIPPWVVLLGVLAFIWAFFWTWMTVSKP